MLAVPINALASNQNSAKMRWLPLWCLSTLLKRRTLTLPLLAISQRPFHSGLYVLRQTHLADSIPNSTSPTNTSVGPVPCAVKLQLSNSANIVTKPSAARVAPTAPSTRDVISCRANAVIALIPTITTTNPRAIHGTRAAYSLRPPSKNKLKPEPQESADTYQKPSKPPTARDKPAAHTASHTSPPLALAGTTRALNICAGSGWRGTRRLNSAALSRAC